MIPLKAGLSILTVVALLLTGMQANAQDSSQEKPQEDTSRQIMVFQQKPVSYLRGSVGLTTMKFSNFDIDSPTLSVGLGGMINRWAGVEIRMARSVQRKDYHQRHFGIDHILSALATLRFPIWQMFYGQAYAGVSTAQELTIAADGDKERNNDCTLSYGLDIGIRVLPHWRLSAGYTSYIDKSYWKVSSIEGSLRYLF